MPKRQHLVLIADDDQAVCEALQFTLQLEGFAVHAHRQGKALLADPNLLTASCLIVDERMPGMDGLELLEHLRSRNVVLPVILITTHATIRLRSRAAAAGVQVVLEKPLLDDVLIASLLTLLCESCGT